MRRLIMAVGLLLVPVSWAKAPMPVPAPIPALVPAPPPEREEAYKAGAFPSTEEERMLPLASFLLDQSSPNQARNPLEL